MTVRQWLKRVQDKLQNQQCPLKIRQGRRRTRLVLEHLEDRLAPAMLTVNSLDDNTTDTNTLTLREAILLVNNSGDPTKLGQLSMPQGWLSQIQTSPTSQNLEAEPFGQDDTIQFDPSLSGQTITLNGSALPAITRDATIAGLGAGSLAISGNNLSGVFTINVGASVTISGLTIEDGAGTNFGGAIFNEGSLTLNNSTLTGNSASINGGAIFNTGLLTLNNSTALSGNFSHI